MGIKKGFTLTEILVSLGVIGVVAAMTIPTLVQNYQKEVYVTTLKKAYNDIDNAVQRKMTDMNADDLVQAGLTSGEAVNVFVEEYLKYNKKCTDTSTGCFAKKYKRLKGGPFRQSIIDSADRNSYILASGAVVRFNYSNSSDYPNRSANILIDTNGTKGPNIFGRDLFLIILYKNGLLDDIHQSSDNAPLTEVQRNSSFKAYCNTNSDYVTRGCFGKILNDNWQMKY